MLGRSSRLGEHRCTVVLGIIELTFCRIVSHRSPRIQELVKGLAFSIAVALVFATGAASAGTITMDPNPVDLPTLFGTPDPYRITLLSGDTENYHLDFQISGPADEFWVGASVMVFDNVMLTDMGSTSVIDMMFFGPSAVSPNAAGWLAVDWGTAGTADFFIEADSMYTTATIYTLSVGLSHLQDGHGYYDHVIDTQLVAFQYPASSTSVSTIPEPSAALVFGVGMLIAGRRVTSRR